MAAVPTLEEMQAADKAFAGPSPEELRQADNEFHISRADPKKVEGYTQIAQRLSRTPPLGIGEHAAAFGIPEEDQRLFAALAERQYQTDQTMKKVGYGTRLLTSAVQGAIDYGMPVAKMVGAVPKLTPEQERYKQQLQGIRQSTDPTIRPDTNWLGRGVQQTAQMSFPMVQSVGAGKAAGAAAQALGWAPRAVAAAQAAGVSGSFLPQTADQTYTSLIGEGVDPGRARTITAVSAPIEAAIESIVPDPFTGYGAAFRGTARQVATKLVKQYTVNFTKELTEEGLQGIVNETALEVGRMMDEKIPDQGLSAILQRGVTEMQQAAVPLALMVAPGAAVEGTQVAMQSAARPERLAKLKEVRAKGYVSAEDGQLVGIQGNTRKERLANADAEIQQLEKEIQNAVQTPEVRQPEVPQEVQSQAPEAAQVPEVRVEEPPLPPPAPPPPATPPPAPVPGERQAMLDTLGAALETAPQVKQSAIDTHLENLGVKSPESRKNNLNAMKASIESAAKTGRMSVFSQPGQASEADIVKFDAFRELAGQMGYEIGPQDYTTDKTTGYLTAPVKKTATPEQAKRDVSAEIRDALAKGKVTVSTPNVPSGFPVKKVRENGDVMGRSGKWITPDETWVINPPKPTPPPAVEQKAAEPVPAPTQQEPVPPQEVVQPPVPEPLPVAKPKSKGKKVAPVQPTEPPKRGEVGGKMAAGEVALTSSGRPTTPFPSFDLSTGRKATTSVRKVDEWLLQNAIEEARSRGDDYNLTIFSGETAKNLPQASKDAMEEYLFGEQSAVPKPFTKPLVSPSPPTQPAAEKPVEPPKAQSIAPFTETGGAQDSRLPRGSVVSKRGQTAIPGMEEEAIKAEARDEEQARWKPYKDQLVSRDIGVTEDAASEMMRGFSAKVQKHLSEDSDYNSTDIAELIAESLELRRSGSHSTDQSRRDTATEMIEPAVAQAMADIAPTLKEAGGWKVDQNVETRYPTMTGKITGFEVVDGTLQARVQPSDGTDSVSVEMSDIVGEYTPEPEVKAEVAPATEPAKPKAEKVASEEKPEAKNKTDVQHVVTWRDEQGNERGQAFASLGKAKERAKEIGKGADVRTEVGMVEGGDVKPEDSPEVIAYKGGKYVIADGITPQQAAAAMEAIRESYKYRSDNEVESLKDLLSGEAIKSDRDNEPQSIKDKRDLYRKAISEQQDAEAERGRLQSDATRAYERRAVSLARERGVPAGQAHGSLSKAKQHQNAIEQAKRDARKDPLVVEAERLAEHAKKVFETAKRHANEFRADLNKATKGEAIPEGSVFVSKGKGASIAIRVGPYDEASGTYEYEHGTVASGKFYGHSYGGGGGDRGLTGAQIREGYGTIEESRALRAVGLQALQAIEQAQESRLKAEAEKQASAEAQKQRDTYVTEYKKPTVVQVMPLGSQLHAKSGDKRAITDSRYAILYEDAPKAMQKRLEVDKIYGSRFSAERPVDIDKALPMKGKLPAKLHPAGFRMGSEDVADHVFLTDGESYWKIDAGYYSYLSADGITFHGPEPQFKDSENEVIILGRDGKRIGGIMPIKARGEGPGSLESLKKAVGDKFSMPEMPKKKAKKTLQQAADDAVQEVKDAEADLKKLLKKKGSSPTAMLDPEIAAAASRVVVKYVKAGTLKFAVMIETLAKSLGQAAVDRIRPVLESEWDRLQKGDSSMEPRTPESQAEPVPPSGDDLTSIKKAIVNEMREMVGLPEMEGSTPQTVEEWVERARVTLAADPKAAIRLVNELATNSRPISQHDAMLLQFRYRQLANELAPVVDEYFEAKKSGDPVAIVTAQKALIDARKAMTDFEETIHPSKETWGRTGVALQQMLRKDFSIEAVLRRGQEANNGEELTPDQTAELTEKAKRLQELQSQFEAERKKNEALEAELASKRQHEETVAEVKREKIHKKSDKRAAAEKKVAAAWEKFRQAAQSTAGSSGANLIGPAVGVAKAYVELGYVRFSEFMAAVRKNAPDADKKLFREAWDQATADAGVEAEKLDPIDRAELSKAAREIQRELVEAGMTDRDAVIDAVHEALQEEVPELTRRQAMDALSRYGIFQRQSQDEIEKLIRGMNSEILKLSQIDQMETAMKRVDELRAEGKTDEEIGRALDAEKLLVEATGLVRDRPSQTVRQLTQKYNELKKSIPATPANKAGMLQTTLNQMERALRNRISDLKFEIARKEKVVKEKRERPTSETVKALQAERDALVAIHKEMFPPKKPSEAQRIASAIRGSDKAIAALEKQIASQDFDVEPKLKLSSPELDLRRARLEQLRAARKALKEMEIARMEGEGGKPTGKVPLSDAELARRAYESSLRTRIADYQKLLAEGDFSPKPKKQPRSLSESEMKLKRQMEDVRHEVLQKYADYHLANLKGIAWTADKVSEAAHLSRAIMTSFDLSALLRQGGLAALGHPEMARNALVETVASIARTFDSANAKALQGGINLENAKKFLATIDSRQAEFDVMHKLTEGPAGELRQKAGLNLPSSDQAITRQEEAFQGRWGKHVPGIALSSRLYTMILNKMRADLFDSMVHNLGRNGQVTMDEAKLIASFVNVATGRSDLKMFNRAAATLNTVFFAPRYVASRFQYLAMPFYLPFKGGLNQNWRVKRAIYQEFGRTAAGVATILGAFALLGRLLYDDDDEDRPQVETDPRSADFLKVKIGETRLDFMAGLSQVFVLSSRLALGQTKSSVTGKVRNFGEGFEPPTRMSVLMQFGRTKFAPVPGAIATIADDWTNVVGRKETPISMAGSVVTPLSLSDVATVIQEQGIAKGTAMSILSTLGVGMNTYGPRTEFVTGTPEQRQAQIEKDLKQMQWDSPEQPAYSEFITSEQLERFRLRSREKKGLVVYNATYAGKDEDEIKARDKNREHLEEMGVSKDEALQLLKGYYKVKEGGIRVHGGTGLKPGYVQRLRALRSIYAK